MNKATLTFDNGPDPAGTTGHVLDLLLERRIKASFFVTGAQLELPGARSLAERARGEGHWIGNHTLTHSIMFGDSDDPSLPEREIGTTQKLIGDLSHEDLLFRPYGGGGVLDQRLLSPDAVSYLVKGGYSCVLWNSVPRDWEADIGWVDRCLEDICALDWAVVVVHDLPTGGMRYLSLLLDRVQALGVEFMQSFPESCVPIRRGRILTSLDPFCRPRWTTEPT